MAVINRVPRGWLGTLDAKTGGNTPREPLQNLTPTFDMTANYLADIPLEISQGQSAGAVAWVSFDATLTVPATELWYVYGVMSELTNTATNYAIGIPAVRTAFDGGGTAVVGMTTMQSDFAPNTNEFDLNSWFSSEPFLAGAGTTFGIWVQRSVGTGASVGRTRVLHRKVTI